MTVAQTENLNIVAVDHMPSPEEIKASVPITEAAAATVLEGRRALQRILDGEDNRLFVVVGPCSIHDPVAGLDYARRLKALADEVAETMLLVMRVYFEKPRTSTGWKGFINDPYMDDSFRIDEGMAMARRFLLDVCEVGLPTGTEALDPIAPQYYGDLISWTAIGARTSESQTHREMSSGLSTGRLQERHRRRSRSGDQCHCLGFASAQFPRYQRQGAIGDPAHRRQPLWAHRTARWRWSAQLRFGVDLACRAGAQQGKASGKRGGGLLACQLVEETRVPAPGDEGRCGTRSVKATARWSG